MPRPLAGQARRKILNAAEERLWRDGFKKTTIDEIASDAGVGKGTVYLYFDSKEDIALSIIAQYKIHCLERAEAIAHDLSLSPAEKLTGMLLDPILEAHSRCDGSPAAQEMIIALHSHFRTKMKPYFEQEIALIAQTLEEGNRQGAFAVEDSMQTARSLKYTTLGFYPSSPWFVTAEEKESELRKIVEMVLQGLRPRRH